MYEKRCRVINENVRRKLIVPELYPYKFWKKAECSFRGRYVIEN